MTPAWHPDPTALVEYASGRPTLAAAASIEAHLLACPTCRIEIAPHASREILADGRARLRDALVRRPRPLLIRIGERLGLSDANATLLTESRAMSDAWLASLALVLGFVALSDTFSGWIGHAVFLLVAPLAPVVGVGLVYSNTEAALEHIIGAAPFSSLRLLLLRTSAVLLTSVPMCLLVAGLTARGHWQMVAWLVPSLALTVLVLALSTWLAVEVAAAAVALGWAFLVGSVALHSDPVAAVTVPLQPLYLVLAASAVVVIVVQVRRGHIPGGVA